MSTLTTERDVTSSTRQDGSFRKPFPVLHEEGLGVLDIGARGGVHAIFNGVAPLSEVVGFEPDAVECQRLTLQAQHGSRFKSLTYLPVALGEADGEDTLHLCRSPGASSFYQPNRALVDRFPDAQRYDVVDARRVPMRSLDSLRREPLIRLPRWIDFIKIDTQGSELRILRGGAETLRSQVVALEVEVEFASLYDGQPLFRDVDTFVASFGFSLFKLRRQEWVRRNYAARPSLSAGQLVFADALYLRDPLASPQAWIPKDAHQIEALILLATLFDLHDFALELLSTPQFAGQLEAAEPIRCWVERRSRQLQSFHQRLRAARAWYEAGRGLRRYAARWGRGDDNFYSLCEAGQAW